MNTGAIDFLDLRAPARSGAMRRAVTFSLVLHAVLVVCVGLHWHKRVAWTPVTEGELTIEFTTESGSSEKPGREIEASAALSDTAVPSEPAAAMELVADSVVVPRAVPEPLVVLESATPVEPAVAVVSTSLAASSIVSETRVEASLSPGTNAAVIVAKETVHSDLVVRSKVVGGRKVKPGLLAQPLYRKNPEPAYPLASRRRRQEGVVLLAVRVSADGHAASVALKRSSGFKLLDDAATGAVVGWEFVPARDGSRAVESEIEVPVRFSLTH